MIYADSIIENNSLFLRNLNINAENTAVDVWSTASSSYSFYDIPYEQNLTPYHYYYGRAIYKYTTTNQSPTWMGFYTQGGSHRFSILIENPVANTEYILSGIIQPSISAQIELTKGRLYNGDKNAISGVTAQTKNVLMYDVTELFIILRAANIATTTEQLKTWCDQNLEFIPRYTNYDIRDLIANSTTQTNIYKGTIETNEFVEADGMQYYSVNDTLRNNTYFDQSNPLQVYNNSGGGTVTHTRVSAVDQNSPFKAEHPYVLKITTNGTASPQAGGFIARHTAAANKIFIEKFVAKIPVGYNIVAHYNSQGTDSSVTYIGSRAGTGDWEEYTILYKCGTSGTFSVGGHVSIDGTDNTNVTWYLAYVNNCDITANENLKFYSVLPCKNTIKNGIIFSREMNCGNIFPNGNCEKQEIAMLPNGWQYDTTDYAGNATCSIVQPVGAAGGIFGKNLKVIPNQRYKISYWVKCKQDMGSFLTAIRPKDINRIEYGCTYTCYQPGTKTQLTQALNPGDTVVKVKSNANWIAKSNSRLGFQSTNGKMVRDYVAPGNSTPGVVDSITGTDTINLKVAYSGTTQAVNTYIMESYDGGTYPYPINKIQLPTDNTWKYVEGYFGCLNSNSIWDGAGASPWNAQGWLPGNITQIDLQLNYYSNTGTVPIKFSDIRIEPVSQSAGQRHEEKIQIIGGD